MQKTRTQRPPTSPRNPSAHGRRLLYYSTSHFDSGRVRCNYQRRQPQNYTAAAAAEEDTSWNGIDEMNVAAAILEYMHDLHDAGVEGVVPHRVPYNILMTGWAALASFNKHRWYHTPTPTTTTTTTTTINNDHHGKEFKAEEILRTMMSHRDDGFMDASPDVISYERVILAWTNSGHPDAGKRALWWLNQLWKDYDRYEESTT